MTKFTKAVVHHAEDMFAWRDPNADNQMHWVADLKVDRSASHFTEEFIDTVLEDVYQRTNNINGSWIDNDRIICYKKPMNGKGHRSTSVGDTIALHTEDGRYLYYRVASFGFDKI
jgi:hypothetical protein|tara:strand:- start:154 stop:498 length:345 start_codon:yes stop_codon:yes gene_type:complete